MGKVQGQRGVGPKWVLTKDIQKVVLGWGLAELPMANIRGHGGTNENSGY